MTDTFLHYLKLFLDSCIAETDQLHSLFCRNPQSDFTRDRKTSRNIRCCPLCGVVSDQYHSTYHRSLQAVPIRGKIPALM